MKFGSSNEVGDIEEVEYLSMLSNEKGLDCEIQLSVHTKCNMWSNEND